MMDIRNHMFGRFELRTKWEWLAFPQYGVWRYLRFGKIGIRLWEIK